jgi:hypothetical protein
VVTVAVAVAVVLRGRGGLHRALVVGTREEEEEDLQHDLDTKEAIIMSDDDGRNVLYL